MIQQLCILYRNPFSIIGLSLQFRVHYNLVAAAGAALFALRQSDPAVKCASYWVPLLNANRRVLGQNRHFAVTLPNG